MPDTPAAAGAAPLDAAGLTDYIRRAFANVATTEAMGYLFFFYGEDRMVPFATLATADNDYDRVSNLDRPSVYRLNLGVSRDTYTRLFGPPPALGPDGVIETGHDFTALDQLMPHPVYAPQAWVCVLSPSPATFEATVRPLLAEAYERAARRQSRRDGGGE